MSMVPTTKIIFTAVVSLLWTVGAVLGASPVAVDDGVVTAEDTAVDIAVLANDTGLNPASFTVSGVTNPNHGKVVIRPDNKVMYILNLNYTGMDSFTYTVRDADANTDTGTVTVAVNSSPTAVSDTAQTDVNTPKTINVLANDSDVNGDTLTIVGVNAGLHGGVVINSDNTITYTPAVGFSGTDVFSYTISDGHGGTASATVRPSRLAIRSP